MPDSISDSDLRRTAERRADARLGFAGHAIVYLIVNAGLAALNLLTSPQTLWFYWPLLGWGVGLAAHGASVFLAGSDLRERAIATELERLQRRREPAP